MTEVWATSAVFLNEVKFNWKINDFTLMLNPKDTIWVFNCRRYCDSTDIREMASPEFKNGKDKFCLHIREKNITGNLSVNGVEVNPNDYHVVVIAVKSEKGNILTGGSLTIDTEEGRDSGVVGDSTRKIVQTNGTIFKNQTSKIVFQGAKEFESCFCIKRLATQIEMKVKIYIRSPITNTIGYEPVADTGLAKLSADMRALLNRSTDCSDFIIECGGKTFACHESILRAKSTVLDAMFQNEMKEKSGRSLTVIDVGPNTMACALEYMYTGGVTAKVDRMKELIYIADKYDMEGLMEMCFRKLPEIGDDMMADFLFMADKHKFTEFKKAVMIRINMNKSKYVEDQAFMEKLQEAPHLLVEFFKL